MIIGGLFWTKYTNYSYGLSGEELVVDALQHLDDCYYLLNDVMLPESYGNIDHIILGPNGIFVIESKNYYGEIVCNGDEWHRHYEGGLTISMRGRPYWKPSRDYDIGSPSKQVKRNAVKLKQIIESQKGIFKRPLKMWVEGIVAFTNSNVDLKLNNPTVPVLKVEELYDYIKNTKSKTNFSPKELESIGNLILRCSKQ
ncbi:MAG: nuclease-related domain-containing protein [Methanocellales archaeon]|nr:nuclease-related domain-containing protein [Methanocellales archaeon]